MAVRGHVNGMAGSYVIGWALAEPDHGNCEITVRDEAGDVLATGFAERPRADLASLGAGRTNLAFRIPVINPPTRRVLHVLADGVELPGSPFATGAGQYDKDCTVEDGAVIGWVTERVADFAPPMIQVVDQHGAVVGEAQSVQAADEPDPLYLPARFKVELADRCFGAGELRLHMLANGVRFAERDCELRLAGNLDELTDESFAGWLVSPDAPVRAFEFGVYQNGALAGTATCDLVRDDVAIVYPGCETPGFALTLRKPAHSIIDTTVVSFRFAGSDLDLFDGPYVVASRPAAVLAARRAANAAFGGLHELGPAERAVVQVALKAFMASARKGTGFIAEQQQALPAPAGPRPRLTILIPIYRDAAVTKACIESVLAHRNPATDQVVLINDASPEPEMAAMLDGFALAPNLFVLLNRQNQGFVKSVNRGLSFARGGDVLLLNSDTLIFAGGLDEMCRVAAAPGVGTVTAMSNNATIFSYPHDDLRDEALDDIDWPALAAVARVKNAGLAIEVPTGHGFCLLIKGEALRRLGPMNEAFGRGYGEENDFVPAPPISATATWRRRGRWCCTGKAPLSGRSGPS